MIENLGLFLDQDTHTLGGNIPKLELVKCIETFSGELDAVIFGIGGT
jgi:hypothetical protein